MTPAIAARKTRHDTRERLHRHSMGEAARLGAGDVARTPTDISEAAEKADEPREDAPHSL